MSCGSGQQHYFLWFGVMIMINACWLLYLLCYVNKAVAFSFQFQGGVAAFIWKQAEGGQGELCQPASALQACRRFSSLCLAVPTPGVTRQRARAIAARTSPSCLLPPSGTLPGPRCASSYYPEMKHDGWGRGRRAEDACRPQTTSKSAVSGAL